MFDKNKHFGEPYYTITVVVLLVIIVFGFSSFAIQSLHREAEMKKDFEAVQANMAKIQGDFTKLGEAVAFKMFLEGWQVGLMDNEVIMHQSPDSRESQAALFLLDNRALTEKEGDFRAEWESREPDLTEFVIAEHYLKDGEREKAREIYQRLYNRSKSFKKNDDWLAKELKVRLWELGVRD